jgi:hypothetical protein
MAIMLPVGVAAADDTDAAAPAASTAARIIEAAMTNLRSTLSPTFHRRWQLEFASACKRLYTPVQC